VSAVAALLICVGCASTPTAPPATHGVEATLLIYSGRLNPKFELDDTAIAKLGQLLAATTPNPSFEGTTVTPSILGYSGIVVVNGAHASTLPDALAVHGTNVETRDGDAVQFRSDPGEGLQTFLLDLAIAQKAITRETLERIR
jgi:hypothetical protein